MTRQARKRTLLLAVCGVAVAAVFAARSSSDAADRKTAPQKSRVVRWEDAPQTRADWGRMRRYFTGETFGTRNMLTAVAVLEPGKAVHKAHRHAEEEYLVVADGSGTWSLAGKEFPAKTGDVLYVEPWVFHGLTNTGDKPLVFLVIKYSGKGVKPPPRPDDRPDEQ